MRKAELELSSDLVKGLVRQGDVPTFPYFAAGEWSLDGGGLTSGHP
ncbi:MAG: hypothetical protein JHC13_06850 [Acidilobus sp.]|nr:hypothetical protein [Acidilobus sp.]